MSHVPPDPPADGHSEDAPRPAIRKPVWRRRGILIGGGIAILLVAATILFGAGDETAPGKADAAKASVVRQRVTVVTAGPHTADLRLPITGLLAARDEVAIGTAVTGQRIAAVYVDVGDQVTAGQLLARLETDTLAAQGRQAEAAITRARATLAQAEAANAEAQANLRRVQALQGSSAISAQQADERRTAALSAAAAVDAARADVTNAQAQAAQSRAELARAEIRAPATGTISARNARTGALAEGPDPLFLLIHAGQLEFLGEASERALTQIAAGQPVDIHVNGLARTVEGRVRVVDPKIDPRTRLGLVRIAVPPDAALRAGAFARGAIRLGQLTFTIAVPEAALMGQSGAAQSVRVVDPSGRISVRTVRPGLRHDGWIEILSGLQADERVVATAGAFLRDGDQVDAVPGDGAAPEAVQ